MNLRFPRIAANDDKSLGCRKGGGGLMFKMPRRDYTAEL